MPRNDRPISAPAKTHANAMQAIAIELRTHPPCRGAIFLQLSPPASSFSIWNFLQVQQQPEVGDQNPAAYEIAQHRPGDSAALLCCPCQARTPSVTRS